MKFGYFDDNNKEYVITTPKTPYPWINYLGSQSFFSLISNTAGGYCFYQDAKLRRITRYRYNNFPVDQGGGRYFYICDNGQYWNPGQAPSGHELDAYECRHGMGYTQITGKYNDLSAKLLFFVPLNFNGEVHKVTLKNESKQTKHIKLFSYIEWCLWNAHDDSTNYQRNLSIGEVEVEGSVIYHKTEYRERRNHYAFYSVNVPITGFDTDRDSFLGEYHGYGNPKAVENLECGNSIADGWYPIASHEIEVELAPSEEKDLVFVLGYVENENDHKWDEKHCINKEKAHQMIAHFADAKAADQELATLKEYWKELLSKYVLYHDDDKLTRMVNTWNQYQCMVTFNMSRSASYFETGIGRGMGFRDSNQDLLGFVHQIPERARERILDLAATQLPDGGAYHQYQPLTKKGNNELGGNFNDDPLWLILAVTAYIKETGDFDILNVSVMYDNKEELAQPLKDHLTRAFDHVVNNLGPHGLPLIGRADWNDCLNLNCFSETPGESFQTLTNKDGKVAESVMIAGMFTMIGDEYRQLMLEINDLEEAKRANTHVEKMRKAVMEFGYDGEWFLRAYDDYGRKVGSKECEEGQIFIEPQGFCIMGRCGLEDGKARKALDSVKEKLGTKYGLVLNQPAYTRYYKEYGEITTYPAGYKENAGVFCHNNAWIICAEAYMGNGDQAFDYYSRIAPAYTEEYSEVHKLEPYVYAQMVAGKDAKRFGEAKNSWLTGTASWNFVAISQYILGIHPDYDGLRISPSIPKAWNGYCVEREFRKDRFKIFVHNDKHLGSGNIRLVVDQNQIEGNVIPVFHDQKLHEVHAYIE